MIAPEKTKQGLRSYIAKQQRTETIKVKVKQWGKQQFVPLANNKKLSNLYSHWLTADNIPDKMTPDMQSSFLVGLTTTNMFSRT